MRELLDLLEQSLSCLHKATTNALDMPRSQDRLLLYSRLCDTARQLSQTIDLAEAMERRQCANS